MKIPLKSTDFRGFWSEWEDSNSRYLAPKEIWKTFLAYL